jgi:hypothetical protein
MESNRRVVADVYTPDVRYLLKKTEERSSLESGGQKKLELQDLLKRGRWSVVTQLFSCTEGGMRVKDIALALSSAEGAIPIALGDVKVVLEELQEIGVCKQKPLKGPVRGQVAWDLTSEAREIVKETFGK